MAERMVWCMVGDLTNPAAEPFAVFKCDTSVKDEQGAFVAEVVSLHWRREEAERIVHEFNNGPLN